MQKASGTFFLSILVGLSIRTNANASDSPYQDLVQYVDTVKHCSTLAELKPYTRAQFVDKMNETDPEKSKPELEGIRALYGGWQNLRKRSESKNGDNAKVIADFTSKEASARQGKTVQSKPYVMVVSMVKEGGMWKIANMELKSPKEAADYGIKDSKSMQSDAAWSKETRKVKIPNSILSGTLQGSPASLSSAMLSSLSDHSVLDVSIADSPRWKYMHVYVSLSKPPGATAQWYTEDSGVPQVQVTGTIDGKSKMLVFDNSNGCGIKLQILPKKGDSYPAYMVLRLPDGHHSELKGYLYAKAF